jgi:NAD(P)-dependent dehydrogenase (short-subunit alcohol dehydrogenase family)
MKAAQIEIEDSSMTDLKDLVVLVTDIEHFVGKPSATALLASGATVYGTDPSYDEAAMREASEQSIPGLKTISGSDPVAAAGRVLEVEGRIDVLINNDAFPAIRSPIDTASDKDLEASFEALLFKPFRVTRAVAPSMKNAGAGKILFLTSAAPLNGLANYSMYASARGAANSLMLSVARELAPHNIQVNAVAPNYVENPDYFPPELMANEKAREKILKNIPLGRLGKPEEAGALITFLAGPLSGFITGQVIPFAGGWANAR